MPKKSAIQLLVYKPGTPQPENQRGVVINPHLKSRFEQFLPVGVYLDDTDPKHPDQLRYYFFEQCDDEPRIYNSLDTLKQDLPEELETIFEERPKLFIMGHGHGGYYGLGNIHGDSEQLYDENFDNLLNEFKQTLPEDHGEVFVTLEGCNTDSQAGAQATGQEKTFLERVSKNHPDIVFGGTGPWDEQDVQTGFRSLAPETPITSMAGNVWKSGSSVIFYHGDTQFAVRKSLFATTDTAKRLKINTVEYAQSILGEDASEELIQQIALRRNILTIADLSKVDTFPALQISGEKISRFIEQEHQILSEEKDRYLTRVRGILERSDPIEQLTDRDILILTLGLKEPSVFEGHEDLLETILGNNALLPLLMVSCGKVLIGGPSNDPIIDLLLQHGADINSKDENGMTALHYAAQSFYNYRAEPLSLINKLLESGAKVDVKDHQGRTPIDIATMHSEDPRVTESDQLLASLQHNSSLPTPEEVKESVRKIFQMSAHMAAELLSLPGERREYMTCDEGTLYMPEDAVKKLNSLLQTLSGDEELLSEFGAELSLVTTELVERKNTGQILHYESDEAEPKYFSDAPEKLSSVLDTLESIMQSEPPSDNVEEAIRNMAR